MPHESGVIALLFNTYKAFFRPSTDLDAEQEHWKAIKKEKVYKHSQHPVVRPS